MSLPAVLVAGDSLSLLETSSEHPASAGWALQYVLLSAAGKIEITSSAEGDDHRFSVTSATSAGWAAGEYNAVLIATLNGERTTLGQSAVTVKLDPVATATLDPRSQARRILDSLKSAYESMIASGGMVQTVEINGRKTTFRNAEDILQQINFWQSQINSEQLAEQLQNGTGFGGRILTRL